LGTLIENDVSNLSTTVSTTDGHLSPNLQLINSVCRLLEQRQQKTGTAVFPLAASIGKCVVARRRSMGDLIVVLDAFVAPGSELWLYNEVRVFLAKLA